MVISFWAHLLDHLLQSRQINSIADGVNRGGVDVQPIKTVASSTVVGDATSNIYRRHNNAIARFSQRHKALKISNRAL